MIGNLATFNISIFANVFFCSKLARKKKKQPSWLGKTPFCKILIVKKMLPSYFFSDFTTHWKMCCVVPFIIWFEYHAVPLDLSEMAFHKRLQRCQTPYIISLHIHRFIIEGKVKPLTNLSCLGSIHTWTFMQKKNLY